MSTPIASLLPFTPRPVDLAGSTVGLVVVDPGVGFTREGNLADPARMLPMLAAIGEEYRSLRAALGDRLRVLVFLDTHHADVPEPPYPPHCVVGTGEEKVDPDIAWLLEEPAVTVIPKDCINGFVGAIDRKTGRNAFCEWVIAHGIRRLLVTGDCTDICVSDFVVTALSARNHGLLTAIDPEADRAGYVRAITDLEIAVLPQACATFDAPGHDAATAHHVGLWLTASRGATIASGWSA
jgi:nicotinamidase-related amidase